MLPLLPLPGFMRIILVTAALRPGSPPMPGILLEHAFRDLALQHPAHEWVVMPAAPAPARLSFFKKGKHLASIRRMTPNLVVYASPDNLETAKDLAAAVLVTNGPEEWKRASLSKKLSNVQLILTHSEILKTQLAAALNVPDNRVSVVPLAAETLPVSLHARQQIREQLTAGKEYFLYTGPITRDNNWQRLLQAFSMFKKWQQSGLQLVLSGDIEPGFSQDFGEQLDAYRYRQDVMIADTLTAAEKDELAAAAFVLLSPYRGFEDRQRIIDAFWHGVPVITENNHIAIELASGAAAYAVWDDAAAISQQMIRLYKDEALYNEQVQKGTEIALQFNRQQMLDKLSVALLSAAEV